MSVPASPQRNHHIDASRFSLRASGPWQRAGELLGELHDAGLRRVGVDEVLDRADRVGRALNPAEPPLAGLERPVVCGFAWDEVDATDSRWHPQGITTSHDAADGVGRSEREVVLVSWVLGRNASVRVSFCDLGDGGAPRYRHVLLVEPVRRWGRAAVELKPIRLHAGGIVWRDPYLYVADTLRGVRAFAIGEMLEVEPSGPPGFVGHRQGRWHAAGHRYALPQVGALQMPLLRSLVDRGPRFSFLSLERGAAGAAEAVISGEYRAGRAGARLVSWPLFEPSRQLEAGMTVRAGEALISDRTHLQGVLRVGEHTLLASSGGGRRGSGRLAVFEAERLVADHPWVTGPEDLAYVPERDLVLSLTEHAPGPDSQRAGRVVFGVGAQTLLPG